MPVNILTKSGTIHHFLYFFICLILVLIQLNSLKT